MVPAELPCNIIKDPLHALIKSQSMEVLWEVELPKPKPHIVCSQVLGEEG